MIEMRLLRGMVDLDKKIIKEIIEMGSRDYLHYNAFHCFRKQHYDKKCDRGCKKRKAFIRVWKKLRCQLVEENLRKEVQSWNI